MPHRASLRPVTRPETTTVKPSAGQAMQQLIDEVRLTFPFDLPRAQVCGDECRGCSIKLIEYIEMEMDNWEYRLDDGVIPTFGDLDKLARSCTKIYRALLNNGLVKEEESAA